VIRARPSRTAEHGNVTRMPQSTRKRSRTNRQPVLSRGSSPHSAVENCPAEIWGRIFSEACSDDGSTGRSLSLVSKYIRDTSKPYKYQCLFVEERQLRPLVTTLKKLPLEFRRIRHLFLSSVEWASNQNIYGMDGEFFNTDKNRLLILVSSTLQTLEIGSFNAELYLAFQMPALLDLTVHGYVRLEQLPSRHIVCYPQLRRFHLACTWLENGRFPGVLDSIAPEMKELRVSLSPGVFWPQSIFHHLRTEFASALGTHPADHSKTTTRLPSSVHRIVFLPCFPDQYYRPNDPNLAEIFRQIRRRDKHFVLLTDGPIYRRQFLYDRLATFKDSWKESRAGSTRDYWNPADDEIDAK
jgi:hypothetical protein